VLHQRLTHLAPATLDQRKHPLRQAKILARRVYGARHDLAGSGMGGMALDDHRAACRQRRGGITPRHGKGEREVRCAKHSYRADRALDETQIGARLRPAVGLRRIMTAVEIVALENMVGKEPQLPDRAAALAFQPRLGQSGLGAADPGDGAAARLDLIGDGAQKRGTGCARTRSVAAERSLGGFGRARDMIRCSNGIAMWPAGGRARSKMGCASHPLARDQMFAAWLKSHVVPPVLSLAWIVSPDQRAATRTASAAPRRSGLDRDRGNGPAAMSNMSPSRSSTPSVKLSVAVPKKCT